MRRRLHKLILNTFLKISVLPRSSRKRQFLSTIVASINNLHVIPSQAEVSIIKRYNFVKNIRKNYKLSV
jgi:hypothetical protein